MVDDAETAASSPTGLAKNVQFTEDANTTYEVPFHPLSQVESSANTLQEIHLDDGYDYDYTAASIATVDEDSPWARKNILSLDGGGVRGYSSLLILKRVMEEVGKIERELNADATSSAYSPMIDFMPQTSPEKMDYRPCHYFDYIAGTSTGGLSAIMLGRLRMDIDSTLKEYKELSAKVFEKPSTRLRRSLANYSSATRRQTLSNIFHALRPAQPSPEERNDQFTSDSFRCRTMVCSMKRSQKKDFQMPFLFRSYEHFKTSNTIYERNPGHTHAFNIADVAKATSGAPSYRRSTKLLDARYYDAAIDMNNPSWEVINEVNLLGKSHDTIDLLLSLGSGNGKGNRPGAKFGNKEILKDLMISSDEVHEQILEESEEQDFLYHRLDVTTGLQDVRLNEWKPKSTGAVTLRRIEFATNQYLGNPKVEKQIIQCAQALVESRVKRSRTMMWESFAVGTRYKCTYEGCDKQYLRFENRNELMDHLQSYHDMPPPDAEHYEQIQKLLDAGRTNSG